MCVQSVFSHLSAEGGKFLWALLKSDFKPCSYESENSLLVSDSHSSSCTVKLKHTRNVTKSRTHWSGTLTKTPSQTLKDVRTSQKCCHSQGLKGPLKLVLTKIDKQQHTHTHTHNQTLIHTSWEQLSVELFDSTAGQSVLSERPISWIPGAAHWSWPTLTSPLLTPHSPTPSPDLYSSSSLLFLYRNQTWTGEQTLFRVFLQTHSETHPSNC